MLTPQILQQVVEAGITFEEGYATQDVLDEVEAAISDYINNLGISGDVIRHELIRVIMSVAGVYNCSLTSPASDVILLDDQLPRITAGNITLA